jgi:hypothetical protein
MDFLDPQSERRSQTKLLLGYCLVALAIGIATLVLVYQSFGFTIDRQGEITQNGLLFVSSQPDGAEIYLNGVRYKSNTNTRATPPAGKYSLRIHKTGYRDWERPLYVAGNDVQHFDYPLLFPAALQTTSLNDLAADPALATQSTDKRWLLLARPDGAGAFTEYDLKNPAKPVASDVVLPDGSFTPGTGDQSWAAQEWAADNRHVLLAHTYHVASGAKREYILLDRDTPANSVNLTIKLALNQTQVVSLFNSRIDQLFVYNTADLTLRRVNANDGSEASLLNHIVAYKTYGDDKVLYITDESPAGKATPGQLSAVLQDGQQTITLRNLPAAGSGTFVLSLDQYDGNWYVAVGSAADPTVYVYKNPQSQSSGADTYPTPWRRMPLAGASYVAFSDSAQFLLAESGQNFVVYDLEIAAQYRYTATQPLDAPQAHADWMDGSRLAYVSGGNLVVFDYDYRNAQTLLPASANYLPFFASDYSYLYALRSATGDAKAALTSTPLTIKQ